MQSPVIVPDSDFHHPHIDQLESDEALIFLHIMKTGGTSLFRLLKQHYPKHQTFHYGCKPGRTLEDFERLPPETRSQLKFIHGHLEFGFHQQLDRSCRYITMLREPIRRVVSLYYFLYHNPRRSIPEKERCETLRDFLEIGCLDVDNFQTRRIAGTYSDQFAYGECTAELLDVAKENLSQFLCVGLTEEFDKSLIVLRHQLGLDRILYSSFNQNSQKPTFETTDSRDLEYLRAHNQLDIELYGFAHELLRQSIDRIGSSFEPEYYLFQLANQQYRQKVSKLARIKARMPKVRKRIRHVRTLRKQLKQTRTQVQNEIRAVAQSRFWRVLQRLMAIKSGNQISDDP